MPQVPAAWSDPDDRQYHAFWLNLQSRYDLEIERNHLLSTLDEIKPLRGA